MHVIEVVNAKAARQAIGAGRLCCPGCGGTLKPWGYARGRTVLDIDGDLTVRPDRVICRSCTATHVVLPARLLAHRAYTIDVVAAALTDAAQGAGHRSIAARLAVPADTVRSWLRRAHRNAEALYRRGARIVVAFDADRLPWTAHATSLGYALDALTAAVDAVAAWSNLATGRTWSVINVLTHGKLLTPAFSP